MPRTRPLRIGIDGTPLANTRGFGRFARELVHALALLDSPHQFVAFIDKPSLDSSRVKIPLTFETHAVSVRQAPTQAASSSGRRRLSDMLALAHAAARANLDAFYFPTTYTFFPVWNVGPVVVTAFDTMPLDFPDLFFTKPTHRAAWRIKEQLAVATAKRVLTTSEFSKNSLMRHYGGPPERYQVVPCAPSSAFKPITNPDDITAAQLRYHINPSKPFLMYVGGLSPHKNLVRLIQAFAAASCQDAQLVLVGDFADVFHTHIPELQAATAQLGLEDRVIFTGFVPDPDLACLYNAALALVQPSLIEGFGLPPVEAMACGTPVLASHAGSLPEVVSDAGLLFDPRDVDAIRAAIDAITHNPTLRSNLAQRAIARARDFQWKTTAQQVHALLESLAA